MHIAYQIVALVATSLIWGVTNPLIKQKGTGIENIHESNFVKSLIAKLLFVFLNWRTVLPIALNQLGSLLYLCCVSYIDVSIAVPVVNSLTLVFTTITSSYLGEKLHSDQIKGSFIVILGVIICLLSK